MHSLFFRFLAFFACSLAWGSPATLTCPHAILLGKHATEFALHLETGEMFLRPGALHVLATPLRVLAGTSTYNDRSKNIGGGRLLGFEIGGKQPFVAFEIPGGPNGPPGTSLMEVSRNGNFAVISPDIEKSGTFFFYDLKSEKITARSERYSDRSVAALGVERLLNFAAKGDKESQRELQMLNLPPNGTSGVPTVEGILEHLETEVGALSRIVEPAQIADLTFSSDENCLLVHTGNRISVYATPDRTLLSQFRPIVDMGLLRPLPITAAARFLDQNRHIVTFHRGGVLALWESASGRFLDSTETGFDIEMRSSKRPVVSPSSEYFAVSNHPINLNTPFSTRIYRTERGEKGPVFKAVHTFRGADIAFTDSSDFVEGGPQGVAYFYSMATGKKQSTLNMGVPEDIEVVAVTRDGNAAATLTGNDSLGLFPLNGKGRPALLKWSGSGTLASIQFSPDGKFLVATQLSETTKYSRHRAFLLEIDKVLGR